MKFWIRPFGICALLTVFGDLRAAGTVNLMGLAPQVEVHLHLSPSEMLNGTVRDYFDLSLSPKPSRYQLVNYGAGVRFFFNRFLGLGVEYDLPSHSVGVTPNYAPLALFSQESFRFGPVLRLPFLVNPDGNSYHAVRLMGGALLSTFTFDPAYVGTVTNQRLPTGSATGWGFFVQVDYSVRLGGNAQLTAGIRLDGAQPSFPGTGVAFPNFQIQFPLQFSLVFGDLITVDNRLPELGTGNKR